MAISQILKLFLGQVITKVIRLDPLRDHVHYSKCIT